MVVVKKSTDAGPETLPLRNTEMTAKPLKAFSGAEYVGELKVTALSTLSISNCAVVTLPKVGPPGGCGLERIKLAARFVVMAKSRITGMMVVARTSPAGKTKLVLTGR